MSTFDGTSRPGRVRSAPLQSRLSRAVGQLNESTTTREISVHGTNGMLGSGRQRLIEDGTYVSTRMVSTPRQSARGRALWCRQTSGGWCLSFTTGLWTSTCEVAASGCFPSFSFSCRGNFAGTYQRPFTTMASCRRGNGVHLVAAQQPMTLLAEMPPTESFLS